MTEIPVEKVSVHFECSDCGHKMLVSVSDLVDVGNPICPECDTDVEMDMGTVQISEANSC